MYIRKILFGIVFIVISVNISYSQSGWVWQNPLPASMPICKSVFFLNQNTGWLGGYRTVLKTTNGGNNWVTQYYGVSHSFQELQFINESTGFSIEYNNIIKTTDSGQNWFVVQSNTDFTKLLLFINENTGFVTASVFPTKLFKTTNQGLNWTAYNINANYDIVYLKMTDGNTGFCYSGLGNSYKTTNGGINWSPGVTIGTSVQSMLFLNENTGWYYGNTNRLWKTTNAGVNWSVQLSNVINGIISIKFLNSQTGYALGSDFNQMFKTTNAGTNWILQDLHFDSFTNAFWLIDENNAIVCTQRPELIRTSNGGANWSSYPNFQTRDYLVDAQAMDINTVYAIGTFSSTTFNVTIDGGMTWEVIGEIPGLYSPSCLFFVNGINGYVGGLQGQVFKTQNGGNTWVEKDFPFSDYLNSLFFLNDATGWAAGSTGIYKTENGGNNWVQIYSNVSQPFANFNKIIFVNSQTGWVFGEGEHPVAKTTNGGNNWFEQQPTIINKNNSAYFLNEQTGWIAANNYTRRTINGGNSWDSTFINTNAKDIYFADATKGWFIGSDSNVYGSSNGGVTWNRQNSFINHSTLRSIAFANGNTGWITGEYGLILKTTTGGNVFISQTSTETPEKFSLYQNYPNPFNPSTNIKFDIHKQGIATLKVFDLLGKEMETLVDEQLSVGTYDVAFNANSLPSGIYFYVLKTGDFVESKKMVLVK